MKVDGLVSALEAVLFAGGEPITVDRLCEVFEIDEETLIGLTGLLSDKLSDSGIMLLRLGNAYQLSTRTDYAEYIKRTFDIKRKTPLSQAALEVLAVIAYNQPVTKSFVEQVRGVDCSGVISTLVEKELIEERGRLELPGRPLLYGTTSVFLRSFSLSSLKEMPELPKNLLGEAEQMTIDEAISVPIQSEANTDQ